MTQPTTTELDLTEAHRIWSNACLAHEDASVPGECSLRDAMIAGDFAAARVIATALEARDAEWTLYKAKVLMEHGERIAERDTRIAELREALGDARRIIAEIDDYMKRPERGDWGVECALCMGELLDDDRAAIARIDAILTKQEPKA